MWGWEWYLCGGGGIRVGDGEDWMQMVSVLGMEIVSVWRWEWCPCEGWGWHP